MASQRHDADDAAPTERIIPANVEPPMSPELKFAIGCMIFWALLLLGFFGVMIYGIATA